MLDVVCSWPLGTSDWPNCYNARLLSFANDATQSGVVLTAYAFERATNVGACRSIARTVRRPPQPGRKPLTSWSPHASVAAHRALAPSGSAMAAPRPAPFHTAPAVSAGWVSRLLPRASAWRSLGELHGGPPDAARPRATTAPPLARLHLVLRRPQAPPLRCRAIGSMPRRCPSLYPWYSWSYHHRPMIRSSTARAESACARSSSPEPMAFVPAVTPS